MTSVREIFAGARLTPGGCVRWGAPVPQHVPGVYVVATTDDVDEPVGLGAAPLDPAAVRLLLQVRPEACVDGARATESTLSSRLASMWVAGEPVVYIGLAATSLADRIEEYYTTDIGARAPHASGWPVKMLKVDQLSIHHASCPHPHIAERDMAATFAIGLPSDVRAALIDRDAAVPFANLVVPRGRRKQHGLSGVKAPRIPSQPAPTHPSRTVSPRGVAPSGALRPSPLLRTRIITAADIGGGLIRVPSASKRAFPHAPTHIEVDLFGASISGCSWDPGFGPDRERSGTIAVPNDVLQRTVRPGTRLNITSIPGGVRLS